MTASLEIFSLWKTSLLDDATPDGRHGILIEASAGTGKTFSIENMVARMMCDPDETEWTPEHLLVVTFTEAATAELCVRLKNTLSQSVRALEGALSEARSRTTEESIVTALLKGVPQSQHAERLSAAVRRARQSLHDFDKATVATIHGFCQAMLSQSSLTAVVGTRDEIAADDSVLRRKALFSARKARLAKPDPISAALHAELFGHNASASLQARLSVLASIPKITATDLTSPPEIDGLDAQTAVDVCRVLWDASDRLLQAKRARGLRTYDDILREMSRAVDIPPFAQAVRNRYRCVLIDEFQDTDAIQYGIFHRLFMKDTGNVHRSLVFVGDPKQAIYGFRGADIDTYLSARGDVARLYRLPNNYRTHENLVRALNTLFRPTAANQVPTETDEQSDDVSLIDFAPVEPVKAYQSGAGTVSLEDRHRCALEILTLTPEAVKQKSQDYKPAHLFIKADILRLLKSGTITEPAKQLRKNGEPVGAVPVRPICRSDIAVLVRTNKELAEVEACFGNDIRTSASKPVSIFKTKATSDLLAMLKSAVNPRNARQLAWSAMTPLFGKTAGDLGTPSGATDMDDRILGNILFCRRVLEDFQRILVLEGFTAAFDRFEHDVRLSERLLTQAPDTGREYLAVLRILAGRLDAVWQQMHSLAALTSRFEEMIAEAAKEEEPAEADQVPNLFEGDVVTLQTMHSSKGLEYPIVYLPDPLGRKVKSSLANVSREHLFRAMPEYGAYWLGLGDVDVLADASADVINARYRHDFEEEMRLLYVALTRAKSSVTMVFTQEKLDESPLTAFLTGRMKNQSIPKAGFMALTATKADASSGSGSPFVKKLRALAAQTDVSIRFTEIPEIVPETGEETQCTLSAAPALTSPVLPSTSTMSFTKIASITSLVDPSTSVEYLEIEKSSADEDSSLTDEGIDVDEDDDEATPFSHPYPYGKEAGKVLHTVIEATDFRTGSILPRFSKNGETPSELTQVKLAAKCPWMTEDAILKAAQWVEDMVHKLVVTPFVGHSNERFHLADVAPNARRSEMDFLITLPKGLTAAKLNAALAGWSPRFAFANDDQDFDLTGYLTGSIDLAFTAVGKWWIIDWKSNRIARDRDTVTPQDVEAEMDSHRYHLQSILYMVAFRRFLRERLLRSGRSPSEAAQETARTMGGVFYVFVRWLETKGENAMPPGIYRGEVPERFLSALESLMSGEDPLLHESKNSIFAAFRRLREENA